MAGATATGRPRRRRPSGTAGTTPATSDASTPTATCTSSAARWTLPGSTGAMVSPTLVEDTLCRLADVRYAVVVVDDEPGSWVAAVVPWPGSSVDPAECGARSAAHGPGRSPVRSCRSTGSRSPDRASPTGWRSVSSGAKRPPQRASATDRRAARPPRSSGPCSLLSPRRAAARCAGCAGRPRRCRRDRAA